MLLTQVPTMTELRCSRTAELVKTGAWERRASQEWRCPMELTVSNDRDEEPGVWISGCGGGGEGEVGGGG